MTFALILTGKFNKYFQDGSVALSIFAPLRAKNTEMTPTKLPYLEFIINGIIETLEERAHELNVSSSNWTLERLVECRVEIHDLLPVCSFKRH